MIKTFSDCREMFRRRYIENITLSKPSINMVFGTAFHLSVEAFWKGKDYKSAYDIGLAHLDSLDITALTVREQGKYNELINTLPDMLEVYYKAHDKDEIKAAELIEYEWIHYDYLPFVHLCGKIDRYMKNGVLTDLKTASEIGAEWKKKYKAEKLRDCGLSLYDWFLDTGIMSGIKDYTPKQIAMEVLIKPYKDKPPRLELIELNEIIQYRDRFKQQLNWVVKEMVHYMRTYPKVKPWPMNYGPMCMTKYGECDYLPLCNYGTIPKIMNKYKQREEHLNVRREASKISS
jgi:hypothetical protein